MKQLLFVFSMLVVLTANSQKPKEAFYLYDSDWKPVKEFNKSRYFMWLSNIGDTLYITRTYKSSGCMITQESYSDVNLTMPHGRFAWYDEKGRIDSGGIVNNKRKHGTWAYYNDTLGTDVSIIYDDGRETERRDYKSKIITRGTTVRTFDEEKKSQDSLRAQRDTTQEREAKFAGGAVGYRKYLEKNLVPPTDLLETGTVKAAFIINKEGIAKDIHLLRSIRYSADSEAFRVLGSMPRWEPAYQNGKNVNYQAIQYITFTVATY